MNVSKEELLYKLYLIGLNLRIVSLQPLVVYKLGNIQIIRENFDIQFNEMLLKYKWTLDYVYEKMRPAIISLIQLNVLR